jgi:hypothetical protein
MASAWVVLQVSLGPLQVFKGGDSKGLTSSISDGLPACVGWALPRPSEPGEGRLSCEFWNYKERPGGPKVFGVQGSRKSGPPIRSARSCPPPSQSGFLHMQDPFLKRSLAPPRLQGFRSLSQPSTDCTDLVRSQPMPMCFRRRGKPGARSQDQKPKAKSQTPNAKSQNNPRHVECNTWPDHETGYWKAEARARGCLVVRLPCRARHLQTAVRTVWGYSVRVLQSGIVKLEFNWLAATSQLKAPRPYHGHRTVSSLFLEVMFH